jgi:hypothetical protein
MEPSLSTSQIEAQIEATFWSEQWTSLLGMAAAAITSADAVMDAMRGDLGPEFKGKTAAEAAPEIKRRITAWTEARNALVDYAKDARSDLEALANG